MHSSLLQSKKSACVLLSTEGKKTEFFREVETSRVGKFYWGKGPTKAQRNEIVCQGWKIVDHSVFWEQQVTLEILENVTMEKGLVRLGKENGPCDGGDWSSLWWWISNNNLRQQNSGKGQWINVLGFTVCIESLPCILPLLFFSFLFYSLLIM